MCSELLYPFVKCALGTLFPAYKSWKALKRKDETSRRHWIKYWVTFAVFQTIEPIADVTIIYITPFYYLLKIILITWLVYGTRIVYDTIIDRELKKREKSIDKWLTSSRKTRNEIVALLWFELSRCSVRIITALMSGGLSVLVKSHTDQNDDTICHETSPFSIQNFTSSIVSHTNNSSSRASEGRSSGLVNNNNDIPYRRSKRIIKIQEVNNGEHQAMDTESDDGVQDKSDDVTVEYIITQG